MDFLRVLFKQNDNKKVDKLSKTFQTPIKMIEEQLKILETINLSPIPQTIEDEGIYYMDIKKALMKIIVFIDIILFDKLKQNVSDSKNVAKTEYYWNIISKHFFNLDSVKFINNIKTEVINPNEKSLIFLTLIIIEKFLNKFLKQFYHENFDK